MATDNVLDGTAQSLDIRHFRLVVAIAEEGTVTKAGARLHLTQSAASHQLRETEEKIGSSLFLRRNKKMVLTSAGERVFKASQLVLASVCNFHQEVRQISRRDEGQLRLATECYTCYHWLPSLLSKFHTRFPKVEVHIDVEATRDPIQNVLDGKIDLGIVTSTHRHRSLSYAHLFDDEMVVVTHPDHALARQPFVRAQDFASEHVIVYAAPKEELLLFQMVLFPNNVVPRRLSQVQLTEAIVEMVKANLGVGVMARWAVLPELKAGSLKAVQLTKAGFLRSWSAATLKNGFTPKYIFEFIKMLSSRSLPART